MRLMLLVVYMLTGAVYSYGCDKKPDGHGSHTVYMVASATGLQMVGDKKELAHMLAHGKQFLPQGCTIKVRHPDGTYKEMTPQDTDSSGDEAPL